MDEVLEIAASKAVSVMAVLTNCRLTVEVVTGEASDMLFGRLYLCCVVSHRLWNGLSLSDSGVRAWSTLI